MWGFIEDRKGFDVDLVIANVQDVLLGPALARSKGAAGVKAHPGLAGRAVYLAGSENSLLIEPGDGLEAGSLGERLLAPESADFLLRLRRPVRLLAQVWTNEVAEALEAIPGLEADPGTTPEILGSSIRYWNTKVGGAELLARVPGLDAHRPTSTMVSSLPEAVALTGGMGRPAVLKVNGGSGGVGMLRIDPDEGLSSTELEARFVAAAASSKAKTGSPKAPSPRLSAPLVLEEEVGGKDAVSPSVDYWVDRDGVACVAAAEQILDGYQYRGARFPGRLEPDSVARCVGLGGLVAEALRARGYRGLLNIDFLVDGEQVWLIEINVRQSAPLDQSLRMTQAHGPGWRERLGFSYLEVEDELLEC